MGGWHGTRVSGGGHLMGHIALTSQGRRLPITRDAGSPFRPQPQAPWLPLIPCTAGVLHIDSHNG